MLKKIVVIPALLVSLIFISSCSILKTEEPRTGKIYEQSQVDKKAEYEGGRKQLIQFLSTNLEYPAEAVQQNIQGRVIVKFVVEDNGTISNFVTLKDIGAGCADEIIRVLQKTQAKWNPAKIDKKRVRSNYVLRVIFKIPSDNSNPYIQEASN